MLTSEENELLTRVGRGTPMGELLRRYWFPVAATSELLDRWTKRVRILGEDLVLFKDRGGRFGLIGESCPHRRASLFYGIPTEDGIRCPYHGWEFDGRGSCIDQPNEPAGSTFKDKISTAGYPVEELGGLLFSYLGPEPRPLLPRLDGFVMDGAIRAVAKCVVRCNWLQIMENSMDPVHAEWLHGHLSEHVNERAGAKYAVSRHHIDIAFDEFEYGFYKRRLLEGQSLDSDDWRVGHPMLFPNTLVLGSADEHMRMISFQIRVPIDDENTMHYWYYALVPPPWADVPPRLLQGISAFDMPALDDRGEYQLGYIASQDVMAWETQGRIADRTRETLASTDRGVTLFRRVLRRELKKVELGQDPMCVMRDPERNQYIELHVEKGKVAFKEGFASLLPRMPLGYAPIADDLLAVFARESEALGAGRP